MGSVVEDYHTARWRRIVEIASQSGNVVEVAEKYDVHPAMVSKARRAMNVWEGYPEEELKQLSLDRLYAGALLAQKIGRKKAYELMRTKDSRTLFALAKGGFVRKSLPTVDEGIYMAIMDEFKRFSAAYESVMGHDVSFDRFIETVLEITRSIDDDALVEIVRHLWGDVYD